MAAGTERGIGAQLLLGLQNKLARPFPREADILADFSIFHLRRAIQAIGRADDAALLRQQGVLDRCGQARLQVLAHDTRQRVLRRIGQYRCQTLRRRGVRVIEPHLFQRAPWQGPHETRGNGVGGYGTRRG